MISPHHCSRFFFFNDTATTEIYTLSLHDALPISPRSGSGSRAACCRNAGKLDHRLALWTAARSEEHTSELQSLAYLVCRLLLEKKKVNRTNLIDLKVHRVTSGREADFNIP